MRVMVLSLARFLPQSKDSDVLPGAGERHGIMGQAADSSRRAMLTGAAAGIAAVAGSLAAGAATPAEAASSSTPDWLNVVSPYGADPTGAADSTAAFQNAINALPAGGGVVYVPAGKYQISSGSLLPVPGLRLIGDGCLSTRISASGVSLIDASNKGGTGALDTVEIGYLELAATGADLIANANVARWHIHDCRLMQNSPGNSIWQAASVQYMVECRFERNSEYAYGFPRTVPAWNLQSSGSSPVINQNVWQDTVCYNAGDGNGNYDTSQTFYTVAGSGPGGHRNSAWRNILFEHPYGGMIRSESGTGLVIDRCWSMDTPNPPSKVMGSLFQIVKNAATGAGAPTCTTIQNSGRLYGSLNTGVADVLLDANCVQTLIQGCSAIGGVLTLNLANSVNVCLVGLPTGSALSVVNASSTTFRLGSS